MIVTPEGLNVFPEDVERVVNAVRRRQGLRGRRRDAERRRARAGRADRRAGHESGGRRQGGERAARAITSAFAPRTIWPGAELPRTEGTKKLKRHEIRDVAADGRAASRLQHRERTSVESVIARYTGGRALDAGRDARRAGPQLARAHRDDGGARRGAQHDDRRNGVFECRRRSPISSGCGRARRSGTGARAGGVPVVESRAAVPRASRGQPVGVPASAHARVRVDQGRRIARICTTCKGPVIFAANHQSHMDVPVILAALPGRWRRRVATAMAKEFFKAHFFPEEYSRGKRFTNSLELLPVGRVLQHVPAAAARGGRAADAALCGRARSADGFSVLIFPEGKRTEHGEIAPFRPGVGDDGRAAGRAGRSLSGSKASIACFTRRGRWPNPVRVRVIFGAPMQLSGDDYVDLTAQVEAAVRKLGD